MLYEIANYLGFPGVSRLLQFLTFRTGGAVATALVIGLLIALEGGALLLSETVGCWIAESEVAELLAATEKAHIACQIGSYPFWKDGRNGANFVIRSVDAEELAACSRALADALEQLGKPAVAGGI